MTNIIKYRKFSILFCGCIDRRGDNVALEIITIIPILSQFHVLSAEDTPGDTNSP